MDERKRRHAILGLMWEAKYVNRNKGVDPKDAFMAEIETLDEDLAATLKGGSIHGETLLDVGTGVGWQAIRMAELGFNVTATDVSTFSLSQAKKNAESCGVHVEFVKDNVLHTKLDRRFDVIVDRGCFAGQAKMFFSDYVESISGLIRPDGHYLLTLPQGSEGPKLALLAEKFAEVRRAESWYLGPKGERWKTWFFHFRPNAANR